MKNLLNLSLLLISILFISSCCLFKPSGGNYIPTKHDILLKKLDSDKAIGVVKIKSDTSNRLGLIILDTDHYTYDGGMPTFFYSIVDCESDVNVGDTVAFDIYYSEQISFAKSVSTTTSRREGTQKQINTSRFDFHIFSDHPSNPSHKKGNIIKAYTQGDPIKTIGTTNYFETLFKENNDSSFGSPYPIYLPISFNPYGCADTNNIYLYYDSLGQNINVVTEIGCTHQELH